MRCFIWDAQNVIQVLRALQRAALNARQVIHYAIIARVFGKAINAQVVVHYSQIGLGCRDKRSIKWDS